MLWAICSYLNSLAEILEILVHLSCRSTAWLVRITFDVVSQSRASARVLMSCQLCCRCLACVELKLLGSGSGRVHTSCLSRKPGAGCHEVGGESSAEDGRFDFVGSCDDGVVAAGDDAGRHKTGGWFTHGVVPNEQAVLA